jgi:hypothetical protein
LHQSFLLLSLLLLLEAAASAKLKFVECLIVKKLASGIIFVFRRTCKSKYATQG